MSKLKALLPGLLVLACVQYILYLRSSIASLQREVQLSEAECALRVRAAFKLANSSKLPLPGPGQEIPKFRVTSKAHPTQESPRPYRDEHLLSRASTRPKFQDLSWKLANARRDSAGAARTVKPHNHRIVSAVTKSSGSFKMAVHNFADLISDTIVNLGGWEQQVCTQLEGPFTQLNSVQLPQYAFLDIGSNIGFHSLCIAKSYPGLQIISIEANSRNYRALEHSISLNRWQDRMHAYKVAVSDGRSNKPLCFRTSTKNMGGNSAVDPAKQEISPGWHHNIPCDYVNVSTVDRVLLDTWQLKQHKAGRKLCPLAVKMDVEGFEHRALMGAKRLFGEWTPCIFFTEFHVPLLLAAGAASPQDTIDFFEAHGYVLRSPTMSKVNDVILKKRIADLQWEHKTMSLGPNAQDTCWNRCLP